MREVDTLRERRHKNIIPLLASFSAGREEPVTANDPQECLHMLFPRAEGGDMKAWLDLQTTPVELIADDERHAYVYRTIRDIVSGVRFIHREVDAFRPMFHHDLKPSNILLFFEMDPSANVAPVWKISDFGNAKLKDIRIDQGTGTVRTDENKFGTYIYRPPEYFNNPSAKHGRPFDVYSLGCVLLELATVLQYGWSSDGLPKFITLRRENTEHVYTGPEKPKPDLSFHNSPNVTEAWIEGLRGRGTRTLCELLDLITLMLQSDAGQRIFIWEVEMELYDLMNPHAKWSEREARLKDVVQYSRTPLTQLHNQHNPLQRAIERNKPGWWEAVLGNYKWSYSPPAMTDQLRRTVSRVNVHYSTLAAFPSLREFKSPSELIGRHETHEKIEETFKKSNCVGLYGISGIG